MTSDFYHILSLAVAELAASHNQFSTIDVIRQTDGIYLNDHQTSVATSNNARVGRFLSDNAERL